MERFVRVFIAVLFVMMQTSIAVFADTVAPVPKGVCETFIKNPKIITHNGQHLVTNFANLVQLPAEVTGGNTIIATGKSGKKFKVRLAAASAPKTKAADFVRKQIADAGGKVVMFHDGPQTDKNDERLQLRLVCVINSKNELVCLDELLVRNGLANAADGDYSSKPYFQHIKPKKKPESPDFPTDESISPAQAQPLKLSAPNGDNIIADLFAKQRSNVQVSGSGVVTKMLKDDNEGGRHQRCILKLASGQTLLIAHNIDIAPRLDGLAAGDTVEFYGEYFYNSQGGGIHWTHRDAKSEHTNGWLKWNGKVYQ
ncbi:MAG: DUF3465 domain-containing protein [Planctomycetaceae bacterium]|jgi:hypothetical protein|nr:DUF3465 domain-containing protein [Planctomycetaceae bacterium]